MPRLVPPVVPAGMMRSRPQPTIIGSRVVLRPWLAEDAGMVMEAYSTPDIERWHFHRIADRVEAEEWIADAHRGWQAERVGSWAIVANGDARPTGRVALHTSLDSGCGEVSYWTLPAGRQQGLTGAAVEAVVGWAFEGLGLHRIELRHSVHNEASCGVARRAGFALEGTLRQALLHADGWHDTHLHARLSPDATESSGTPVER